MPSSSVRLPTAIVRALAFDRNGLAPAAAIRSALGVTAPLVLGAAAGHPADGAIAAAGALPVGVAAMSSELPAPPIALLLTTTAGMALSTFVGSLCAGHAAAVVVTLAVWGFVAGLLVALGRAATIVGVQAVVGLIVFGRYPGGVDTSALHALAVLAGGLIQTLFAIVLRPPVALRPERQALADLYQRLAALAAGTAYGGPSGEAIAATSEFLTRRAPDAPSLRDLVDEAARIRLELQALASVPDVSGVEDVTGAAAGRLRRIARALDRGSQPAGTGLDEEPPDLPAAVEALRRAAPAPARTAAPHRFAASRAAALLGQIRAVDRHVEALAGARRLPLPRIAGARSALQLSGLMAGNAARLRQTLTDPSAPAFRHGVRLGVLLPAADIVSRLLPWQRGYWVPLTTMVVLKPDYAATVQRGLARIIGTGAGILAAGLLVSVARPSGTGIVIAVAVTAWASYALFGASYVLYTFALTALVVLLISTGDPRPLTAVADRGLDTLLGGAIALLGYLAWPTREEPRLRTTTAKLLSALADYAETVLTGFVVGRYDLAVDRPVAAARARAARRARADAQASLDRALAEPTRLRPDTETARSVLAAARRIVIALHALRTTLQDTTEHVALPEVGAACDGTVTALRELAVAVADARVPELPDLREAQQQLERLADAEPATLRGRRLALVAAHLDPLVDAIDTVAHVLSEVHFERATTTFAPD